MPMTMNQLAGFVRLGPQVYPERPNAAQIIERGPHGQRLAADPVAVRLREPKGSGFKFWIEEMNVAADQSWNPRQRVVGLLGLGAPTIGECQAGTENMPPIRPVPPGSSWEVGAFRTQLIEAMRAACRGRVGAADRMLADAIAKLSSVATRPAWAPELAKARAYVNSVRASSADRLQQTELQESAIKAKNVIYSASGMAARRRAADTAEITLAKAYQKGKQALPKQDWWKYALILGGGAVGLIVLSNFARGFGQGVARAGR